MSATTCEKEFVLNVAAPWQKQWETYAAACDEYLMGFQCNQFPVAGIQRYAASNVTMGSPTVVKLGPCGSQVCPAWPTENRPIGEFVELYRTIAGGATGMNVTVRAVMNWPGNSPSPSMPSYLYKWVHYWYIFGGAILLNEDPFFVFTGSPAQLVDRTVSFTVPIGVSQDLHLLIGGRHGSQLTFNVTYTQAPV